MIVFEPIVKDGCELCYPDRGQDFEALYVQVDGTSRIRDWKPIPVHLVHDDEGKALKSSDAPWLGAHALVFRRQVIDKIGGLLREHGELLALQCAETDLWVFNPTRYVDAFDEQASVVRRFSDGRIMHVKRYVFRADSLDRACLFKIPLLRASPTFVTQCLVEAWRSADLRGLDFIPVWSG